MYNLAEGPFAKHRTYLEKVVQKVLLLRVMLFDGLDPSEVLSEPTTKRVDTARKLGNSNRRFQEE